MKVRFAPSPTGPFHIGGARSALFNFLLAKKEKGTFLVRIEDTDLARSTKESEENIKAALKWLGMNWDEGIDVGGDNGPYRQTERLDIYKKYVDQLIKEGKAYYCYCTEEELDKEREAQMARGETPKYNGHCAHLTEEQIEQYKKEGRKPTVRLRVPLNQTVAFDDMVRGHIAFESNGIGDFVIVKSDGIPVYNFAVVVDDHTMGITHVIRAEEHVSNTPRQLVIFDALGWQAPTYGHISLILGADKKKMSKRHGATSVDQYRQQGYLPEALVNFLALLGWSPEGEDELFTMDQLIEQFSMDHVAKNPAVFDIDKLNWINFHYMKKLSDEELYELCLPHLQAAGYAPQSPSADEKAWLMMLCTCVRDHVSYGAQIVDKVKMFFTDSIEEDQEHAADIQAVKDEDTYKTVVAAFKDKLQAMDQVTPGAVKAAIKSIMKETKLKGKFVFMPIRVAITGQMHGADLNYIVTLFGKDKTAARLEAALA
ncbi:MAG: glutamate--tRNA ligase [Veillonellaceae bacterium]|nr:glutamate--tRNA ligase [Veillonellaceae bacterium]